MQGFESYSVKQVSRSKNKQADALSKLASLTFAHLTKMILVEVLKAPSSCEEEIHDVIAEEGKNCMTPILDLLNEGKLPEDEAEAARLQMKAKQYMIKDGCIYKKSYLLPLLRCIGPDQKIHKCEGCQLHEPIKASPKHDLVTVTSAWPFYKWGMDIVGPFLKARGSVKFLLVAVDYFTKWPEVKPLASITAKQVERMNWSIVSGIKTRLGRHGKDWLEELPSILWAIRTMEKTSHGRTSYSLVFGSEAVILDEIGRVRHESFKVGDLVLRNNDASRKEDTGKLGPKWEGPYQIAEAHIGGSYKLNDMEGKRLPRH
ncbi:hypothetical protein L1987_23922 [Smallanthus sonchifolius]|uniref:Uncharacterized protein n=1 Tax=Smallanthus sonchifolius TaxID=185202 RepID=A0ACB9IIT2_9ASTR|nr:hypothetical protein L1987_23922 [Smallanthus sonchifolius]